MLCGSTGQYCEYTCGIVGYFIIGFRTDQTVAEMWVYSLSNEFIKGNDDVCDIAGLSSVLFQKHL